MKKIKIMRVAVIVLAMASLKTLAQANSITATNVVTVTVTNTINVTNFIAAAPAPALVLTNVVVKYPWKSSVALGLTLTKGNSDTLLFTGKILTDKKTPVNEYSFGADGAYGKNEGVANAETLHGFGQWNRLFSDRLFGYLRSEALHDGIADIRYRVSTGPGAGYYFIKAKSDSLAGEFGASYVFERLGMNDDNYATLRLAERYEHKFGHFSARFWENAEILPQVDKFQNYLFNAEVGLEAAVAKDLSLQTYVDDSYNSEPAPGAKRNDVKLVSALAYSF